MHRLKEQHVCVILKSITHVHRYNDMRVHNYSLKCTGCYICESGIRVYNTASEQYSMFQCSVDLI